MSNPDEYEFNRSDLLYKLNLNKLVHDAWNSNHNYIDSSGNKILKDLIIESKYNNLVYLRYYLDPENTSSCSYLLNVSSTNTKIEIKFKTEDNAANSRIKSECTGIIIMKIA